MSKGRIFSILSTYPASKLPFHIEYKIQKQRRLVGSCKKVIELMALHPLSKWRTADLCLTLTPLRKFELEFDKYYGRFIRLESDEDIPPLMDINILEGVELNEEFHWERKNRNAVCKIRHIA
jgi:hypothetical protein